MRGLPRKGIAQGFGRQREPPALPGCEHFLSLSNTGLAENSLDSLVFESLIPARGTPADHPLGAQRHRENLPGQPAVRVPGAPGGAGADRRGRRHLQRGPQVQQGEAVVRRLLLSPFRATEATTTLMAKQRFLQCSPLLVIKVWERRVERIQRKGRL